MKRTIIVTDLTRFQNRDIVCMAGIDRNTGECIRPMPYLGTIRCRHWKIVPGAILTGNFVPSRERHGPHQEDCEYSNLVRRGACSSAEFKSVLEHGLFAGVADGFETSFGPDQKHIPLGHTGRRSLITVRTRPASIYLAEDSFKPGKITLDFTDGSGQRFQYLSITDLRFHDYAMEHHARDDVEALNDWILTQDEVLLRLGLSRHYRASDGREGYWLKVNGIYTFPDHHDAIQSYSRIVS